MLLLVVLLTVLVESIAELSRLVGLNNAIEVAMLDPSLSLSSDDCRAALDALDALDALAAAAEAYDWYCEMSDGFGGPYRGLSRMSILVTRGCELR